MSAGPARGTRQAALAVAVVVGAAVVGHTDGHGAMVSPLSRNAFDRVLPQYLGGRNSLCNCGSSTAGCDTGSRGVGLDGQACLYFSQGCMIGCATCSNTDQQAGGMPRGNESNDCVRGSQPAGSTSQPTLPKRLWTMNRNAVELSVNDVYRFHPWRAPGSAPVTDACGTAGGTIAKFAGPGHAVFSTVDVNGTTVKFGDKGSVALPKGPPTVSWKSGATVEVKWGMRFNHGGGYQYRLCSLGENLTEDCFQRTALDFVTGSQQLEWLNGSRIDVPNPQYVNEGVIPVGINWARNPIPFIFGARPECANASSVNATDSTGMLCQQFEPPCASSAGWAVTPGSNASSDVMGPCSGNWIDGLIVDRVIVPDGLAPGLYVLGHRWDCEETSQIWSTCADIMITA
eukprot:m.103111 g.103111  ORF g.103111 m.103111 type:complete len:400 (+) comp20857_c0_seq2:42-1241(+)